jgi:hypothetical protein
MDCIHKNCISLAEFPKDNPKYCLLHVCYHCYIEKYGECSTLPKHENKCDICEEKATFPKHKEGKLFCQKHSICYFCGENERRPLNGDKNTSAYDICCYKEECIKSQQQLPLDEIENLKKNPKFMGIIPPKKVEKDKHVIEEEKARCDKLLRDWADFKSDNEYEWKMHLLEMENFVPKKDITAFYMTPYEKHCFYLKTLSLLWGVPYPLDVDPSSSTKKRKIENK